jgi:hypothetical protein
MYTIVASTPDTAARTTVDDHAPSKRFEGATTVVFGAMESNTTPAFHAD